MPQYSKALVIFRRDLRLQDNTALNAALARAQSVIACFIFDPRQIEPHPYQSQPALQFMLEALADLQQQFQAVGAELTLFYDTSSAILRRMVHEQQVEAVFMNRDYSPFSRQRDDQLDKIALQLGVDVHYCADVLLTEPEQALKSNQSPYRVFTAFYENARLLPVAQPQELVRGQFLAVATEISIAQFSPQTSVAAPVVQGGRQAALALLANLGAHRDYLQQRDFPALQATSLLSAHLKFGTCSVREVYYAISAQLGNEHPLIRQLYWRDFFTHVAFHYPYVFGRAFVGKFDNLVWDNNLEHFNAWREGRTGFPIVDAGMRELNSTGFMHNRVRMIVASFLVKDLHIHWRWGERYFAQHLVDYDPCVNNGNWQWAASTGCDAQPYFRIFNPWLQQQKFDPECAYIYRWIPELQAFDPAQIHHWDQYHQAGSYPAPMLDHGVESNKAKALFKAC